MTGTCRQPSGFETLVSESPQAGGDDGMTFQMGRRVGGERLGRDGITFFSAEGQANVMHEA